MWFVQGNVGVVMFVAHTKCSGVNAGQGGAWHHARCS